MQPHYRKLSTDDYIQLILQYQKTQDTNIFHTLLAHYDYLLLRTIHQIATKYKYLQYEDKQDLYHIAILGLNKGLKVYDTERKLDIAMWVCAYAKSEILQKYRYKRKEYTFTDVCEKELMNTDSQKAYGNALDKLGEIQNVMHPNPNVRAYSKVVSKEFGNLFYKLDADIITKCKVLNAKEQDIITAYLLKGATQCDLAIKYNVTNVAIHYRIQHIIKKLKAYLGDRYDKKIKTKPKRKAN